MYHSAKNDFRRDVVQIYFFGKKKTVKMSSSLRTERVPTRKKETEETEQTRKNEKKRRHTRRERLERGEMEGEGGTTFKKAPVCAFKTLPLCTFKTLVSHVTRAFRKFHTGAISVQ